MEARILSFKMILFLLFASTICVSQSKRVYFSYDSQDNVIFTIYGDGDGVKVEATINGRKLIGTMEGREEVQRVGPFNERYLHYNIFYEDKPSFCTDGIVFSFEYQDHDWELNEYKRLSIVDFRCWTRLGCSKDIGYLYLINQPDNIKLLDQYDGYRTMKDIPVMNDKAYYLEQVGAYAEAIYILKKVISKSPDRVVAYLNIADAYWGNNEKKEAKKSYEKYVGLMKSQGKDMKKIPQRVYDRMKVALD